MQWQSGSEPFRYWICDNWARPPLSRKELNAALLHKWQVHYDNELEHGKRTSRNYSDMIPKLRDCFTYLKISTFVDELRTITGISSLCNDPVDHGAGLHLSTCGSYLQAHLDYERHPHLEGKERRLNAILFMHDRWEKEWGGELLLCDMNGKAVVEIEPKPGRLALFECGATSMHGVRVITHREAVRLSCAVYYLANARPEAVRTRAMFLPNRSHGGVPHEVAAV